ncbi:MAG: hypothetical protein F6J97_23325, partial [Leptolyngbya sp. SIO4C1]|nr:hypothetical protein [Leptolyngbya sp. SIO4C1]
EKARIQLKIRDTWDDIRRYEQEYAQRLSQQVRRQNLPEPDAQIVTAELIDEIEILAPLEKRDKVQTLLQQILAELQKPDTPASAKLKVALPIIPSIVSIELEGDTESVVRHLFPTFLKAYEALRKK